MSKNKQFWDLGLNSHTMVPTQRASQGNGSNVSGINKLNKIEIRYIYKHK